MSPNIAETPDKDPRGSDDAELPRCDVLGCDSYAPVKYTDGTGKRCLSCLDADRKLGEVPTSEGYDG